MRPAAGRWCASKRRIGVGGYAVGRQQPADAEEGVLVGMAFEGLAGECPGVGNAEGGQVGLEQVVVCHSR